MNHYKWWPGATLVAALALLLAALAPSYVARYSIPLHSAISIYGCFVLLLAFVVTPGLRGVRFPVRGQSGILLFLWCLPYLVYAAW